MITDTTTENTVTITAAENATANVTLEDVNIVISDPNDGSGKAAVTIDVADNASANVTLDGVNIDVSGTGDVMAMQAGKAAVEITGNGDVTIELDGTNTVQSGVWRAGVEKNTIEATETEPASGKGNLTITDENGTAGSLNATSGIHGAGIGGGIDHSASNITITGSAEVTAQGGHGGAGIGGSFGDGSNITISGSAVVTAQGGEWGAGIGGGSLYAGSYITITDNAKVTANGGADAAGIGGFKGTGSDITVSEDAQVKAQGGVLDVRGDNFDGAGAAIGDGGAWNKDGDEVEPNTGALTPNGKIEYYAPGADMETESPIKTVIGTYVPPQVEEKPPVDEEKPDQPAQSAEESAAEAVYTAPLYRVINQDGKALACKAERKDGVLTITVDADFAALTGKLGGIQTLKAQGVDTIVFVTNGATSTFALSDLLSQGSTGDTYTLTHDGAAVTFTLGAGKTDISTIPTH